MSGVVCVLVDSRGLSRPIRESWLDALQADAVWYVGDPLGAPDPEDAQATYPQVELSAVDLGTAWLERGDESVRVVAVVDAIDALLEAADAGLPPTRVVLVALDGGEDGERLAAGVIVSSADLRALDTLASRGFEIVIQSLPRVTPRPWSVRG